VYKEIRMWRQTIPNTELEDEAVRVNVSVNGAKSM